MRKALGYLLLAGVFVLLLSALVESPPEPASMPPLTPPAAMHAQLTAAPAAQQPAASAPQPPSARMHVQQRVSAAACMQPAALACDANGHVLAAARYEDSVYAVFRPETAGG